MTTIGLVKKHNKIAIGSDSLATYGGTLEGEYLVSDGSKLLTHNRNVFALTGHASLNLLFSIILEDHPDLEFSSRKTIFRSISKIRRIMKDEYFLQSASEDDQPFETWHTHCLIANPYGAFGVYELGSIQEYSRFFAFGSGGDYALGAFAAMYERSEDPEEILRAGLTASALLDSRTAGPFHIQVIELADDRPESL